MRSILIVNLNGQRKDRARIFSQEIVTIGSDPNCDITLDHLTPEDERAVFAEITRHEDTFLLQALRDTGFTVFVNGQRAATESGLNPVRLGDGDTIELCTERGGTRILFQILPEDFEALQLARRTGGLPAAPDAPSQIHPLTATVFVRELTRSLWSEIPRRAKIVSIGLFSGVALIALSVTLLNLAEHWRIGELAKQMEADRLEKQRDKQDLARQKQEIDRRLNAINLNESLAERIDEQFRPGVCLIQGSFTYIDKKSGRELRYRDQNDSGEPLGNEEGFPATIDGKGSVVEVQFTGTGFLADDSTILTNRHVVEPWWRDESAQQIVNHGLTPQIKVLRAFFPGIKIPFNLELVTSSSQHDVAVCTFGQDDYALPTLPVDDSEKAMVIGQPVVLLGYPTGIDGLLQRIDDAMRTELSRRAGRSIGDVAQELASRGLIRPLNTQGSITDLVAGRIVHSAPTTEGGSGGPIFNRDGKVIGINSAVLVNPMTDREFPGSNFGVPISVAKEMLAEARKTRGR